MGCADWSDLYAPQYSSLAQSVEHSAVNRVVVGSSPTGGAILGIRALYRLPMN